MKFNMKRMLVFALLAVVFTGVLSWNTVRVQADSEPFTVDGTGYTTFAEAVGAIENATDKTVVLAGDAEITDDVLLSGYSLDLAGHSLTCNATIVGTAGTNLLDSSEGKTGLLKCSKGSLTLSADNTYVPVWNGEGYIFVQPNVTATYQMFDTSLTEDGSYRFYFRPGFGKVNDGATSVATAYLGQYDQDLEMSFELYYSKDTYVTTATENRNCIDSLSFSNAYVKDAYANGKVFYVRVENAGDYRYLGIKTVIESCGVRYTSEETIGKTVFMDSTGVTGYTQSGSSYYWDTIRVVSYSACKIDASTGSLTITTETGGTNYRSYTDLISGNNLIFELKIGNVVAENKQTATDYIELRVNNRKNQSDRIMYFTGSAVMFGYENAVKVATFDDSQKWAELKVYIDTAADKAYIYNVLTGEKFECSVHDFTATEIGLMCGSSNSAQIEYLKIYSDTGLTVGEFLQQVKKNVAVGWSWDDDDNNDLIRPENITVGLYNGDTLVKTAENVDAAAGEYTFEDVPAYNIDGTEASYTVKTVVEGYTVNSTGTSMTLSHTPVITWHYVQDFETKEFYVSTASGTNNRKMLDSMIGTRYLWDQDKQLKIVSDTDSNKCLEVCGGTGCTGLISISSSKSVTIKFKVRLADDAATTNIVLQYRAKKVSTGSNANITFATIKNNQLLGYTLTGAWADATITLNGETGNCTYTIGGQSGSFTIDHTDITDDNLGGFAFYAPQGTKGLLIDDLQIYSVAESAEQ